jgi:tRNA(adenine34) deaminase
MQSALQEAKQALELGEIPVGALIVKQDRVLSTAHNRCALSCDPSAHAEILAIRSAAREVNNYRLDGCTLYVTLEPCLMCCGALLQARIHRLVYAAREHRTGAVVSIHEALRLPAVDHHVAISEGPLAEDAVSLLRQFFSARR